MHKQLLKKCLLIFSILVLLNCEQDDICIESVTESPDLIILMLDKNNIEIRKNPSNFLIRAIDSDSIYQMNTSDSLALPLNIKKNNVLFEFILNEGSEQQNIDTLQINYKRIDNFINTACGYRSKYILEEKPVIILNQGNNWIQGFTILKDTISDEISAHLGILH
tara:strand:- start:4072 stop:4566 length:495 start_codon:yes stop_codon:yes gene_type:complete